MKEKKTKGDNQKRRRENPSQVVFFEKRYDVVFERPLVSLSSREGFCLVSLQRRQAKSLTRRKGYEWSFKEGIQGVVFFVSLFCRDTRQNPSRVVFVRDFRHPSFKKRENLSRSLCRDTKKSALYPLSLIPYPLSLIPYPLSLLLHDINPEKKYKDYR